MASGALGTDNCNLAPALLSLWTFPGVGGVHGDMIRNIVGTGVSYRSTTAAWGAIEMLAGTNWNTGRAENDIYMYNSRLNIARVVPTGSANKPRAWGALACCYLGQPA